MAQLTAHGTKQLHQDSKQLVNILRELGAMQYDLWLPETRALSIIIQPGEHITGVVFGRYHRADDTKVGRGVLVATDSRVLLVDKKPLFISCDEITYSVISGVTYSGVGVGGGTVTLHTRIGDIHIRTFNRKAADCFTMSIEASIFQHTGVKSL